MTTRTQARETRPKQAPAANTRAVAYLRVSISSQVASYSLDAQERLFRQLCRNKGWQPGKVYREEGQPAASVDNRPVFRQLLEDASQGHFDIVVVHSLDRWSRSFSATRATAAALSQHGVSLVSAAQQLELSRSKTL